MATSVWLRVIRNHRIVQQDSEPGERPDAEETLAVLCRRLDIPCPLWLDKNRREWEQFGQTRFLQDAFFEHVRFDRLEIEFVDTDRPQKRSRDPRNE